MKVLKFPNESLFKICEPVTVFDTELKVLLDNMFRTMQIAEGVGLSANQVGLTQRMFVMEGAEKERIYLVNPKLVSHSLVTVLFRESCLSAPGEYVVTGDRREWAEIEFQDEKGNLKKKVFKGIQAVCVEHELEHLDGKSFMESKTIPRVKRKELAKKWGLKLQ